MIMQIGVQLRGPLTRVSICPMGVLPETPVIGSHPALTRCPQTLALYPPLVQGRHFPSTLGGKFHDIPGLCSHTRPKTVLGTRPFCKKVQGVSLRKVSLCILQQLVAKMVLHLSHLACLDSHVPLIIGITALHRSANGTHALVPVHTYRFIM